MKMKLYYCGVALLLLTACSKKGNTPTNFVVDEGLSTVEWTGSAPDHFHKGAFKVSGTFETNGKGAVTAGTFSIPIASITDFDLKDPVLLKQLLDHLKGPEFFDLAVHPEAGFRITKAETLSETTSSANTKLTGDFTLIGQTHTISFPAIVLTRGDNISVKATFKLNRLQWGMSNYSDPKGTLYILPDVDITLDILAKPVNK